MISTTHRLGVLARYRSLMEIPEHTGDISLLEGDTPLIPMPRLAKNWAVDLSFSSNTKV